MDKTIELVVDKGKINYPKLDRDLSLAFSNGDYSLTVGLIAEEKNHAKEVIDHIQPGFDYIIKSVGKFGRNYLVKIGANI
jgi:hypothetical protein